MEYAFRKRARDVFNTGRSRTILLSGNVHDRFHVGPDDAGQYVTLLEYLGNAWSVGKFLYVTYELNRGIVIPDSIARDKIRKAYDAWRGREESFENDLDKALESQTAALEVLRQMCVLSRSVVKKDGKADKPYLEENLVIVIEGADLIVPEAPVSQLSEADRHRVAICQDWFTDRAFMDGRDSVILVTESRSQLNGRIARLPQLEEVEVGAPDEAQRLAYVRWFDRQLPAERKLKVWSTFEELAAYTGGLTIVAMRQMLMGADGETIQPSAVVDKVESFLKGQIGDDVISFKRPTHTMKDLVGNSALLAWIVAEFIPRIRSTDPDVAYAAAIVGGPIRTGKTYVFEAVAGELGIPIIELKNFRSMWVGQTDVAIERIYRALRVITKGLVLIDEADTQFGGVGKDVHETEKRATGKFQGMMSDPALRGRIMWLMMTARIHLLSPDLRGEGRGGDCIIVVQDPEPGSPDHHAFVDFMLRGRVADGLSHEDLEKIHGLTRGYYAGAFQTIRAELKAQRKLRGHDLTAAEVMEVIGNKVLSDTANTRRFQLLQAYVNCTDRRLLPPNSTEEVREGWKREIIELEARGIS